MTQGGLNPTVIGVSLKMYFDHARTIEWCNRVAELAREHPALAQGAVTLFVLPSFPSIPSALQAFDGSPVRVGAQNLWGEDDGAYTGEVSGASLAQLGCSFAEIGHAERKRLFGEGEQLIRAKVAAALRNSLIPVLCVGEQERLGVNDAVAECARQIESALPEAQDHTGTSLVVAYEPEWAIGADEPADPDHVRGVVRGIRASLAEPDGHRASIIYGGSAGPGLLTRLGNDIDGLFLGRFAHNVGALASVLDEAAERWGLRNYGNRAHDV